MTKATHGSNNHLWSTSVPKAESSPRLEVNVNLIQGNPVHLIPSSAKPVNLYRLNHLERLGEFLVEVAEGAGNSDVVILSILLTNIKWLEVLRLPFH